MEGTTSLQIVMGGFIGVLDPSDYGSVIISKSITIDGTGVMASIISVEWIIP
jgi:hypothetical protein